MMSPRAITYEKSTKRKHAVQIKAKLATFSQAILFINFSGASALVFLCQHILADSNARKRLARFEIQPTLSSSNSSGDRRNVRMTKRSNYRDSHYRGFSFGNFQGT